MRSSWELISCRLIHTSRVIEHTSLRVPVVRLSKASFDQTRKLERERERRIPINTDESHHALSYVIDSYYADRKEIRVFHDDGPRERRKVNR